MSEWRMTTVGDVALQVTKGTTPASSDFTSAGVAYVKVEAIRDDGAIDYKRLSFVHERVHATVLKRSRLQPNDLLFTIAGTIGKAAIVQGSMLPANVNQAVAIIRPDVTRIIPRFLYYALRDRNRLQSAVARTVQSVQSNLSLSELSQLQVPQPPPAEQQAIAEVLGALDDKIAANARLISALLAATDATFDRQFGGRELTLMLGELAEVVDCLHSKKPEREDAGPLLMQLNNIRDDGLVARAPYYSIGESDYQNWSRRFETRPWDFVITNVGRVGAVARIPDGYTAALGRNMTGIRPKDSSESGSFIAAALLSGAVRREIEARTDAGSVMSALNVRSVPLLRLPDSTPSERRFFHDRVSSSFEFADRTLDESSTLAATRDALLPQLMSGKLRVRDAEKIAAEAGA